MVVDGVFTSMSVEEPVDGGVIEVDSEHAVVRLRGDSREETIAERPSKSE